MAAAPAEIVMQLKTENVPPRRVVFNKDAQFSVKRFAQADAKGSIGTLTGYAIVWGALSDDRGGYQVRLQKGSATFTTPTMALFHHNFQAVIGNTANGTLRLATDDTGVKVEIDLPDTSVGNDVMELVDKKYIQGMSFCMVDAPDYTTSKENGLEIMDVSKFVADEVTVTGIPSFTQTSIAVADDAAAPRMAASKKNDEPANHRAAHWGKLQKYKLHDLEQHPDTKG